jgi:hypothetical protein
LARDEGITLDAFVLTEADGPGAGGVEATDHVGAGLEEGEDVGEGIHGAPGISRDDHEEITDYTA